MNDEINVSVAGVTVGSGSSVGAGVGVSLANGAASVGANVNASAAANISLPSINSLLGTATGLVDTVLADVNSLLPSGVSI